MYLEEQTARSWLNMRLLCEYSLNLLTNCLSHVLGRTVSKLSVWRWRDGSVVRVLAALPEDLGSVPRIHGGDSQSHVTPVPQDLACTFWP